MRPGYKHHAYGHIRRQTWQQWHWVETYHSHIDSWRTTSSFKSLIWPLICERKWRQQRGMERNGLCSEIVMDWSLAYFPVVIMGLLASHMSFYLLENRKLQHSGRLQTWWNELIYNLPDMKARKWLYKSTSTWSMNMFTNHKNPLILLQEHPTSS